MLIDVSPTEYRLIEDLRETETHQPMVQLEALKPRRWMVEIDGHSRHWCGVLGDPPAPAGKGSDSIAEWDRDGDALIARTRVRAQNSDATLRVQIRAAAPKELVLQILDKLRHVVASDWDRLVDGPDCGIETSTNDVYEEFPWYPMLPRPSDEQNHLSEYEEGS